MSFKTILITLAGCATLTAAVLFPPNLDMIKASIPAVSLASLPILAIGVGWKLLKRALSGGAVPDLSAHSNTLCYFETSDTHTTRIWTNTTYFILRTPRLAGSTAGIKARKGSFISNWGPHLISRGLGTQSLQW
ncbi:hypothetical protein B0H15DRAFT_436303 [Mycena belliarum]|uniref:Uncharacterized protein n=1 Tax=Mycena belliarum TaxID=1033014 RepID=A0AAD6TZ81_9AGAR|nr:hypothetical protein B0H15DRAFT_436303 [Mycena belliae]